MSQDPVRLLPPAEAAELPVADADGQRVLDRVAEGSNVVVLGAPGTGKTSLAPVSYTHLTLPTICSV